MQGNGKGGLVADSEHLSAGLDALLGDFAGIFSDLCAVVVVMGMVVVMVMMCTSWFIRRFRVVTTSHCVVLRQEPRRSWR